MQNYHLTHDDGQWKLKREDAERATAAYGDATKQEAIRQAAQHLEGTGSSLKIHLQNGQFEEERTYPRSADPRQSKG